MFNNFHVNFIFYLDSFLFATLEVRSFKLADNIAGAGTCVKYLNSK